MKAQDIPNQSYTGNNISPNIEVTDAATGTLLKEGIHYTLSYQLYTATALEPAFYVIDEGTYQVIITGINDYSGVTLAKTFSVIKQAPSPTSNPAPGPAPSPSLPKTGDESFRATSIAILIAISALCLTASVLVLKRRTS